MFDKLAKKTLELNTWRRRKVAEDIYEVSFRLGRNAFDFIPGQYVRLTLPSLIHDDPKGDSRYFSITSSPGEPFVSIAFKDSESGFKKTLLQKNTPVIIKGPYGIFNLPEGTEKQLVFVAGGIGVTPFISMLKYVSENNTGHRITLFYVNKKAMQAPYLDFLKKIRTQNPNIKIRISLSSLTAKMLKQEMGNFEEADFFVSGDDGMTNETLKALGELGVSMKQIVVEEFLGYRETVDNEASQPERYLLQRNGADLEALMNALSKSAIVSETNSEGTITYVNDLFVEVSKYSREELIGQNHRILKSNYHSEEFYENLWATIKRGYVWHGVMKNRAKDGTYYWVDSSIAPILGKGGVPVRYISVRFLVTDRQSAEDNLRRKIKLENKIAALSREALVNSDLTFLLESAAVLLKEIVNTENVAVLRLMPGAEYFAYDAGVGFDIMKKGKMLISANPKKSMAGYALQHGGPTISEDITNESRFAASDLLHDSQAKSCLCVVIEGDAQPFGVLQLSSKTERSFSEEDINSTKSIANLLAYAARNHLDKRKDEFLGIASHEIKTPLTSIKTYSQLLVTHSKRKRDEKAIFLLSKIDNQINRLSGLIAGLLDISKINSGKMEYVDDEFNLSELVRVIVNETQLSATKYKIFIKNKNKIKIFADKYRISQVLSNLLNNAINFSPDSERIIVNLSREGNYATVSVQDFGVGIPAKEQELIFERFYKASGQRRSLFPGGLGLGLYISSEIIKHHNGKLWVESKEGEGSTFYFTLPIIRHKISSYGKKSLSS